MHENGLSDIERAKNAFASAKRNFDEGDIFTAANRAFVACENIAYFVLKKNYGGTSTSRSKLIVRLKDISPELKETYDNSYDLRVQADYGRQARFIPLNKENLDNILKEIKKHMDEADRK